MIDVLFENNDFIVCIKPVGIASQNDKAQDMVKLLEQQLGSMIFPVHRLDTAVGGTMVFAKNQKTAANLSKQVQDGTFKKKYLAVVSGRPESDSAILEDLLFKDSSKNKSYVVKRERKGVKKAKLGYELVSCSENMSLLKILLYTGRSHQIRVQFASRKLPLIGDGKYGSKDNRCTVALWSSEIVFEWNGDSVEFVSYPDNKQFPWNLF